MKTISKTMNPNQFSRTERIQSILEKIKLCFSNWINEKEHQVTLGKNVHLWKWVAFRWKVVIGDNVVLLPWAKLENCEIGDESVLGCEVKRSKIGRRVKAKYPTTIILDAVIWDYCNIAAGAVFANYNGIEKGKFILWEWVFVGATSTVVYKRWGTRILEDWSFIPSSVFVNTDLPAFWRLLQWDEIQERSGINLARFAKVHPDANP